MSPSYFAIESALARADIRYERLVKAFILYAVASVLAVAIGSRRTK